LKLVLDETIHLPNAAIVRWTATGTNTGPGDIPPTGKSVRNTGMDLVRFMDGKVTETLLYFDTGDWMTQLGYTFVPPAAE
jgi:predicted ester cyclase